MKVNQSFLIMVLIIFSCNQKIERIVLNFETEVNHTLGLENEKVNVLQQMNL